MFSFANDARGFRDHIAARLMRGSAALLLDGLPGLFSGIEILEVGGGAGLLAHHITPAVRRFNGCLHVIDAERQLLRYTPSENSRVVAQKFQLPFLANKFDLVIGNSTLGGRSDALEGLEELRRVMKPTGVLHMSGFLPSSFEELFDLLAEVCEERGLHAAGGRLQDGRTEFLPKQELETMVDGAGFNIGHLSIEDRITLFADGHEVVKDPLIRNVLSHVLACDPAEPLELVLADALDILARNIDMYFSAGSFPLKISTVIVTAGCRVNIG